MSHHDTILSAYPGLLPGFFTLAEASWGPASHRTHLAPHDISAAAVPSRKKTGRRYRRMFEDYKRDCAAAMSVLLNYADAIVAGDSVVITCALSADQFDRLCELGADLEDIENDNPGEGGGDDEPWLGWTNDGPGAAANQWIEDLEEDVLDQS